MQAIMEKEKTVEVIKGFLAAVPPFDFKHSLYFLNGFYPTEGEQAITEETITKAISLNGQAVVFSVTANRDKVGVDYTLQGVNLDEATVKLAEESIMAYLGLQDDLRELYQVGEQDPAFAPVLKTLYGYHQVRFLTPFENAVWAVISQRTPMASARKLKARLIERYGSVLRLEDNVYQAFPEPVVLAAVAPTELAEILGNERKAQYLASVAQAFATELQPARTAGLSREALKEKLLAVKGIGAWSAEFILIRGYGLMGGLPEGEKRHEEVVSRRYNNGKPVTAADIARFAAPYGNSKGYWAHCLRVAG